MQTLRASVIPDHLAYADVEIAIREGVELLEDEVEVTTERTSGLRLDNGSEECAI